MVMYLWRIIPRTKITYTKITIICHTYLVMYLWTIMPHAKITHMLVQNDTHGNYNNATHIF